MAEFLVVGAGATGSGVARELVGRGHEVTVVTRRGSGPELDGITRVAVDATDVAALSSLAGGTSAIFNCANPPYHRWLEEWPPLAHALLRSAEHSGATLVTLSNLYAYGRPQGLMTIDHPLTATYAKAQVRAQMWRDALSAHHDGRLHAVEVRASDYIGANSQTMWGERVIPKVLKGRSVSVLGDPDAPHSWTYVGDVSATLVAAALDSTSWGQAWHVPTNLARSSREVVADLAEAAGVGDVRVTAVPRALLRVAGLFSPIMRELPKTLYQFEQPFVMDDSSSRAHFGLEPTPWADVLANTLSPFKGAQDLVAA